jgi:hypothetical protein
MLNAGVLLFNGTGRIRNTTSAPTDGNGGTPTIQGLLAAAPIVAVENFHDGTGFVADGRISIDSSGAIVAYSQGGLPMTVEGRIAVDTVQAITHYNAGLPFTVLGRLVLAAAEAPAVLNSFSSAFSGAFD